MQRTEVPSSYLPAQRSAVTAWLPPDTSHLPPLLQEFPILYLFPAGEDAKKVRYSGKLSARAWLAFLKENAKVGLLHLF